MDHSILSTITIPKTKESRTLGRLPTMGSPRGDPTDNRIVPGCSFHLERVNQNPRTETQAWDFKLAVPPPISLVPNSWLIQVWTDHSNLIIEKPLLRVPGEPKQIPNWTCVPCAPSSRIVQALEFGLGVEEKQEDKLPRTSLWRETLGSCYVESMG